MSDNIWDHLAPSTRGLLADMARSANRHKTAELGAVILNTLNPLLTLLVNKHENSAEDVLLTDLRQYVREAMGEGNGAIPAPPVADAFDRVIEFTLYCSNGCVANTMDWCSANEIPKFIVEDDRGGTGSWKINFTMNGAKIIESLSRHCREYGIDVHMNLNWAS